MVTFILPDDEPDMSPAEKNAQLGETLLSSWLTERVVRIERHEADDPAIERGRWVAHVER